MGYNSGADHPIAQVITYGFHVTWCSGHLGRKAAAVFSDQRANWGRLK